LRPAVVVSFLADPAAPDHPAWSQRNRRLSPCGLRPEALKAQFASLCRALLAEATSRRIVMLRVRRGS
jgi:hypothetical protein